MLMDGYIPIFAVFRVVMPGVPAHRRFAHILPKVVLLQPLGCVGQTRGVMVWAVPGKFPLSTTPNHPCCGLKAATSVKQLHEQLYPSASYLTEEIWDCYLEIALDFSSLSPSVEFIPGQL